MMFSSMPIVGLDSLGNPINLVANSAGTTHTSAYVDTIGGSTLSGEGAQPSAPTAWKITQVTSIAKGPSGLIALGYGSNNLGITTNIVWKLSGSDWTIGPSGVGTVRSIGATNTGSEYVIADSQAIRNGEMTLTNLPPAGGFAELPPIMTSFNALADSMCYGSVALGASLSALGVWVGPTWEHQAGLPVKHSLGSYSTTYTYPGASGSNLQTQVVYALPPTDNTTPPTEWATDQSYTSDHKGYYGLIGAPSVTVTWTQVPS